VTSTDVARRILARDAPAPREKDLEAAGQALQRSCTRMTAALWRTMGPAGSSALLARAFARTEGAHPILKALHRGNGDATRLEGIAESVKAHGIAEVTAAIEAFLATVIDILARLIGEDMATRLISGEDNRPNGRGARTG
jgi:hypothetical protein